MLNLAKSLNLMVEPMPAISAALASIPKVGAYIAIAINIWATVVMIQGLILVRETPKVRTWVTCLVIFGFLFLLGVLARVSAQRQLEGAPNFSEFNVGEEEDTAFDNELENRANQSAPAATSAPTTAPATR